MMISTFGRAAAEAERKENTPRPSCLRKSARVRFAMIGPASATTGAMRMSEARPGETRGASFPKASTAMHDDTALSTPGADSAVHRRAEADPYLMPSSPADPERSARRGGPIPHRQVFPDSSRSFQVVIGKAIGMSQTTAGASSTPGGSHPSATPRNLAGKRVKSSE